MAGHQLALREHVYGAYALHDVPVYVPAFAVIHCTYLRRDGQAELTFVAGYIDCYLFDLNSKIFLFCR